MICLMMSDEKMKKDLRKALKKDKIRVQSFDIDSNDSYKKLYNSDLKAIVVDAENPQFQQKAWLDILNSLGRRMPVIVLSQDERRTGTESFGRNSHIGWVLNPKVDDVLHMLNISGVSGEGRQVVKRDNVTIYNSHLAANMLREYGALSILTIDASKFRKIALEFGSDVYCQLQDCFQQMLYELWGSPGSFRNRDVLMRRSPDSNIYYILLEGARAASHLPAPGALEKLANRILLRLQSKMWSELSKPEEKSLLPSSLQILPDFSIGHSTVLYNKSVDSQDEIDNLLDSSQEMARVQMVQVKNRQKELLQNLIRTEGLLEPHYQAIFSTEHLTTELIEESKETKSILPLADSLYGFESLIRVCKDRVDDFLTNSGPVYLDAKYLHPEILFHLAKTAKLALELDQACLQKATNEFTFDDYQLFVNILPRNLYYIDHIQELLSDNLNITFELSETENINNFELLLKVRDHLNHLHYGIAADDFGRGYASFERILRLKPDVIKLDRSLIQDIDIDRPKQALLKGFIEAGKVSHSKILAEGVERYEELELLSNMGVDYIQGYLLHKPQAMEEVEKDLQMLKLKGSAA